MERIPYVDAPVYPVRGRTSHGVSHEEGLRPWRRFIALAVVTTTVLAGPRAEAAHVADRIVAVVNSDVIVLSDLEAEVADERARIAQQYSGEEFKRHLRQLQYDALTKMIEVRLQIHEATKRGIMVTDREVRDAMRALERQGRKLDGSNPHLMQGLKAQMVIARLQDLAVGSTVMVTDSELEHYYEEHLSRFMLPEEYRISQILIKPQLGEEPEEVRRRAMAVLDALQKGAEFTATAAQFSDGPEALRGGSLGLVRQGELLPQIERTITTLRPGEVSGLVETPQGLHIIRLDGKSQPRFQPFAEVKEEIRNLMIQQKREDFYQAWLADLKNKAYIEVKF